MGARGSKAAAYVGKAASRAAAAAAVPTASPAAAAAAAAPAASAASQAAAPSAAGVSAAERQREAALAAQIAASAGAPPEQAADTEALVKDMNRLLSSVKQRQFEVYRHPETDRLYALKKQSKEEKAADLVGRLTAPALKQLLEEHAGSVRRGAPLAAAELARRYGADEALLEQLLRHNAAPVVQQGDEGGMVASWPASRGSGGGSGSGGGGSKR